MRRVGSDKDLSGRLVVCSLFFIFIELEGLWKAGICYWLALVWFASLFFFSFGGFCFSDTFCRNRSGLNEGRGVCVGR